MSAARYPAGTIVWIRELRQGDLVEPRERVRIEAWSDDGETAMCFALDANDDDPGEGIREVYADEIEGAAETADPETSIWGRRT